MVLNLLRWLFDRVIGKIPGPRRQELRQAFGSIMREAVEAAAEGTARGLRD